MDRNKVVVVVMVVNSLNTYPFANWFRIIYLRPYRKENKSTHSLRTAAYATPQNEHAQTLSSPACVRVSDFAYGPAGLRAW